MKQYRAAVIGSTGRGDYGHGLDEVWLSVPGVELVAVADDNKMGLAAAARKLKVDRTYSDYRQLLDEVKPDVVSIGPRWLDVHRDMVLAAAQRNIHMFCEKPLCRTLAEADEMVAACERTHTRLVIAHQTRYSPKIPVIRSMIDGGKLGRVLELRGRGKEDARGGAEDLWVLGSHIMDLMRMLAGDALWCCATVLQNGQPISKKDIVEGNEGLGPLAGDQVAAMYGMSNGATAYFASRRNSGGRPARFGVQVFGTGGILDMTTNYMPSAKFLSDSSWSPGQTNIKWQNVSSAGLDKPEPIKNGKPADANVLAVRDLIASIEENRQPASNIYEARAAVEMIAAVFESQRLGRKVSLPLESRQNPLAML